jgi:hypothetical protein
VGSGGKNRIEMTGTSWGYLTVIEARGKVGSQIAWLCRCECGAEVVYRGNYLRSGNATTCGCRIGRVQTRRDRGFGDIARSFWSAICDNAKSRNIEVAITPEYAWRLFEDQQGKCALSGEVLILHPNKNRTASLDRINSSIGYEEGNLQWVHKRLNVMKMALPQKEFVEWCRKVARYGT